MKELMHTYETSIQRKDQVISNLTQALSKQKDKQDAMKTFSEWKVQHVDLKREVSLYQKNTAGALLRGLDGCGHC